MPIVKVEMWPGRTHEQKQRLAKAITDAVVNIGKAPAEGTFVIFEDVPKENWAVGGILASDAD
jgi:4-oxalocrotonate tautomerase